MIYELPLTLPIGSFRQNDESRKLVKEKLESIISFEKRLLYYNNEIRSLATYEKQGAQIYYEWGLPDQQIKVFCNCNNCRKKPDFDDRQETIYQKVRTKEIERLIKGICSKETYKDKLTFLFSTKGFYTHRTPAIWDNHREEPLIDLRPGTKEETTVLNQFVIADFEKEYKDGKGFSKAYNGFDFEKERQRLNERLNNTATDKTQLLQYIKTTIEKHFGYPETLHTNSREMQINRHILQQIDRQLEQLGYIDNLFAKLCFGETIDLLNITGLDSSSLLNYTHVSEIFKYYQYVKQMIEQPDTLRHIADLRTNTDISDTIKKEQKPTIKAYAIMHVYLAMYGGQAVTQQNKNELVKQYGYTSGKQLRNEYTCYQNEDKRLDLNTTNKRSAKTHLERYNDILPLLESQNKQAFEAAKIDFENLNNKYNKYY